MISKTLCNVDTDTVWSSSRLCTVLSEFGGWQLRGDPEGLFSAALENEAGGDVGTAVEVLFAAGQAQIQSVVTERSVLVTLRDNRHRVHMEMSCISLRSIRKECKTKMSYLVNIELMAFVREGRPVFSHQRSEGKTKELLLSFVFSWSVKQNKKQEINTPWGNMHRNETHREI